MKAYHFLKSDMTAGSGDEPPWKVGEERTYEGELELCQSGYHSSPTWYDCLAYAPGPMACIVEISGETIREKSKSVSRARKLINAVDASRELRLFACDCAERAMTRANWKDERSWNAIRVARLYAEGNATEQELKSAAWSAAWSAQLAAGSAEQKWQRRRLNWYIKKLFGEVSHTKYIRRENA